MSYDVSLGATVGAEWAELEGTHANYTSNVWPMFRAAFGPNGIERIDGLTGKAATHRVGPAIDLMLADPGKFRQMNPVNGWGNYEGALAFLQKLYRDCRAHPEAIVRVT